LTMPSAPNTNRGYASRANPFFGAYFWNFAWLPEERAAGAGADLEGYRDPDYPAGRARDEYLGWPP
jgi:hypothetical protein